MRKIVLSLALGLAVTQNGAKNVVENDSSMGMDKEKKE